ncbi:MAG TPA: NAD(P)/FAD-dependent oxidoreductase [Pedobacter sp.]|jgi:flavin-dependent dehydrogenase
MLPKSVTIIGGGLSGLTASLLLNRAGFEVTVIEKKTYPFHRVCGEYISNEVLPFLKSLNIDVANFQASIITELAITSPTGKVFRSSLDLGGFGLSRYTLDNFLYQKALASGVKFLLGVKANSVQLKEETFEIQLSDNSIANSTIVIAAYGKRSNLDVGRKFFYQRSPYLGVKYHVKIDFPKNLVQLDNFEGGYCGTVKIEQDRYNLCYLTQNRQLKTYGSLAEMEKQVLFKNSILKERFLNADFLNEKPEVINEISFEKKPLVENHILYCGDAAGMISPLCGNGMAMAIHAAKVLCDTIIEHFPNRQPIEQHYQYRWQKLFKNRLLAGRLTQKLFGKTILSELAIKSLNTLPNLSNQIIKRTHGNPF